MPNTFEPKNVVFSPLYDFILVLPVHREQMLDGILLPDTSREDMLAGQVVSVGEGYIKEDGSVRPLRLQPGDVVFFGAHAGIPIQIEGVELLTMREAEVRGRTKNGSITD